MTSSSPRGSKTTTPSRLMSRPPHLPLPHVPLGNPSSFIPATLSPPYPLHGPDALQNHQRHGDARTESCASRSPPPFPRSSAKTARTAPSFTARAATCLSLPHMSPIRPPPLPPPALRAPRTTPRSALTPPTSRTSSAATSRAQCRKPRAPTPPLEPPPLPLGSFRAGATLPPQSLRTRFRGTQTCRCAALLPPCAGEHVVLTRGDAGDVEGQAQG